jgi:hypothetical protein
MVQHADLRSQLAVGRHALDPARMPEIAAQLQARPTRAPRLLELLWDDDPGVANRAASVLELISRTPSPALRRILADFKEALLGLLPDARFIKLRWNLAFSIPRLPLTPVEARRAAAILHSYLDDKSSIVKTAALQGMADLTRYDPDSLPDILDLLRMHSRSGTPAMRARSRHLLQRLDPDLCARQRSRRSLPKPPLG